MGSEQEKLKNSARTYLSDLVLFSYKSHVLYDFESLVAMTMSVYRGIPKMYQMN